MNFDRYLATSYPIFHRTSVTKGKLLTLLAILIIIEVILKVMTVNDFFYFRPSVSYNYFYSCHSCNVIYQLFVVVRNSRKNKRISPGMKKAFSLKNISSCLLVVACVMVLSSPASVYIVLRINSPKTTYTLDNVNLTAFWTETIA